MGDTFLLNGKETPFKPGQMILDAARNGGIEIPTLCYLKDSTPTGACRICCVEVKGARSLMAACSTPVTPGMEVFTESGFSPSLQENESLSFCFPAVNIIALICEANGNCRLQDLAYFYKITKSAISRKGTKISIRRKIKILSLSVISAAVFFAAVACRPVMRLLSTGPSRKVIAVQKARLSPVAIQPIR